MYKSNKKGKRRGRKIEYGKIIRCYLNQLNMRAITIIKKTKQLLSLLLLTTSVCGCGNNPKTSRTEMNEEEFQQYNEQRNEDGMIAIETTFEPTLELTDEIKNSTLEDLIRQGKGKLSKVDQEELDNYLLNWRKEMKKMGLTDQQIKNSEWMARLEKRPKSQLEIARDYKLKFVPATSNLAKVYYLEDMGRFIEHNETYYYSIISKMQEENQGQQEQKNWDKYL